VHKGRENLTKGREGKIGHEEGKRGREIRISKKCERRKQVSNYIRRLKTRGQKRDEK